MAIKNNPSSGSKDELMKDLTSLKNTLDEDDDNVPLLLEDDDIPTLGNEDDNIPVLDTPDDHEATDKASLEAALRQLESMELAPKSRKATPTPPHGIEEKIRANAAPPIISTEELTRVRENPFLNSNQKAQLDANRKLREEAQQAAKSATSGQKPGPAQKPAGPVHEEVIEFTDNPFLKASSSPGGVTVTPPAAATPTVHTEELDGSAEILKELGEDARPYQPRVSPKTPVSEKKEVEGLGDIILDDEEPVPARKTVSATTTPNKFPEKEIDLIVDEIIEEYMVILEAALRKKLKEKLPDLLK